MWVRGPHNGSMGWPLQFSLEGAIVASQVPCGPWSPLGGSRKGIHSPQPPKLNFRRPLERERAVRSSPAFILPWTIGEDQKALERVLKNTDLRSALEELWMSILKEGEPLFEGSAFAIPCTRFQPQIHPHSEQAPAIEAVRDQSIDWSSIVRSGVPAPNRFHVCTRVVGCARCVAGISCT